VPDIDARLPGRGLWLLARRDIVERAIAKRQFARAARRPVDVPQGLADRLEGLLVRRCCDALGLARRAGLAIAGFERVSEAMRRGDVALLLLALDGAEGGRRRLTGLAHRVASAAVLEATELGGAFGRDRAVFVAVGPGPLCSRLQLDLGRLAGFRPAATLANGMNVAPARPEPQQVVEVQDE
jgi:ribosomal protein L7Ae-like RNA K-turn-binding protein